MNEWLINMGIGWNWDTISTVIYIVAGLIVGMNWDKLCVYLSDHEDYNHDDCI